LEDFLETKFRWKLTWTTTEPKNSPAASALSARTQFSSPKTFRKVSTAIARRPKTRSITELLVHIASPGLQERIHGTERRTTLEGFDFPGMFGQMAGKEKESRSKAQVIELLRKDGEHFASMLDGFTNDFLAQRVAMPAGMTPQSRTRFEMILGVKEHEMHHRAQLMLIERMLGIVPHLTREMQARIAAMTQAKATA
jgi:uncharacterized damage-inducible protein DinB